jgi:hypothetical protein
MVIGYSLNSTYLMKKNILFISLFISLTSTIFAQDRFFARTYQSNVLAKGGFDFEYWTTFSTGKVGNNSPYAFGRHLDSRYEMEFGLGGNVQTAFYFNTYNFKYAMLDPKATSFPTQTQMETSFSNEWKFKLSDPVANKIGSAIYLEGTVGSDEYELEAKIILDKRINNELFALNFVGECEFETVVKNDASRAMEFFVPLEIDYAYMHFFNPQCGVGLEITNRNLLTAANGWEHSVLFGGPTFYVNQGKFFAVFNILPQIINLHKTDVAPAIKVLDVYEDFDFRLVVGYSF